MSNYTRLVIWLFLAMCTVLLAAFFNGEEFNTAYTWGIAGLVFTQIVLEAEE